jgi:predicted TIM-barrel fold metal-dependent hydrolase
MFEVDTHSHIFETGLELAATRHYAPAYNATVDDYRSALDAHGVRCGVLVQPSFLGTNNDYMTSGLRKHRERLRGIAVVDEDIGLDVLDAMNADGVVGIRLNLIKLLIPDLTTGNWRRVLAHVERLDWHVQIHRQSLDLPLLIEPLLNAGVNIVVDHFGRPEGELGVVDDGFRYLLTKGKTRRVWVKLSGGYRNWADWSDQRGAIQSAAMLLDEFGPERLVWGSDWPHTGYEGKIKFNETQENLKKWVSHAGDRKIILQDTPLRLYHFDKTMKA